MDIRKVFSSSAINLFYQVIPALSAILMVPLTIQWYGAERFSIFSLAISVIVLFNYLNFGIAQSTNRELSKEFSSDDNNLTNKIICSGFISILSVGILIAVVGAYFSGGIASSLTSNEPELYLDTKFMITSVLLCSPLFLLIILFRSILEAKLLFKYTSLNRALLNAVIFISPAICFMFGVGIKYSIGFIVIAHAISFFVLGFIILLEYEKIKFAISKHLFVKLLTSGGWLTLISLSSVGFLYIDKFIIGSVLGLSILAYYVAAYDLISRASILYGSISAAFFPAFSFWFETKDISSLSNSIKYLVIIMCIVMSAVLSFVLLFSYEIIHYWIDSNFGQQSSIILKILSIGIFFSSLSIVYMRLLCASGYEKLVSIYYVVQAFIYVSISYLIVGDYGNIGIAWLFTARCFIEYLVLLSLSRNILGGFEVICLKSISYMFFAFSCLFISFLISDFNLLHRLLLLTLIYVISIVLIIYEKNNFKNAIKPHAH